MNVKKAFALTAAAIAMIAATSATASIHTVTPGYYGNPGFQPPIWAVNGWNIPDDTTTATPDVTNTFTLTGTVAKDCSYYGGPSPSHTIPLGAIGVKNGDTETSTTAFNQASTFNMDISSSSAGCNFNNTVTISKNAQGLVNAAAGGYDSNQFTANIPYKINGGLTGTTNTSGPAAGTFVPIVLNDGDATKQVHLGAWRSNLNMGLVFTAQSKGLVAGNYTDTITVELAVDTTS
jgi:hypothetical protein